VALSKSQIADELAAQGLGGKRQITNILNELAELAADEIAEGEDFVVPGIAKVSWAYTAAQKKGEKYKKGDTYIGFGGIENTAEADSKARPERIRLRATAAAPLKRLGPSKSNAAFGKSKTARAVRARKRS